MARALTLSYAGAASPCRRSETAPPWRRPRRRQPQPRPADRHAPGRAASAVIPITCMSKVGLWHGLRRIPTSRPSLVTAAPYSGSWSPSIRSVVSSRGVPWAAIARSASRPTKSPGLVQLDDVVQPDLEWVGLVGEVVDVGEQQAGFDPQDLNRRQADRAQAVGLPGAHDGVPQFGRVIDGAVDLETELARVSGARHPGRDATHPHALVDEAEIAQRPRRRRLR